MSDIPQHKKMAMGEKPSNSGAPTREKYAKGGAVSGHGSHGHGKGVPGKKVGGFSPMKGK